MAKKPENGVMPPVTEKEARAAFIAIEGRRSARQVREDFLAAGRKTPSDSTYDDWRAKYHWVRLAKAHDERVATVAAEKIANTAAAGVVSRAAQFDTLATESLVKAIEGLDKIDIEALKASDIRALCEVSERAAKMYELLEGRATDRTDNLTRGKMDDLMNEMKKEIEERLARVPTVH